MRLCCAWRTLNKFQVLSTRIFCNIYCQRWRISQALYCCPKLLSLYCPEPRLFRTLWHRTTNWVHAMGVRTRLRCPQKRVCQLWRPVSPHSKHWNQEQVDEERHKDLYKYNRQKTELLCAEYAYRLKIFHGVKRNSITNDMSCYTNSWRHVAYRWWIMFCMYSYWFMKDMSQKWLSIGRNFKTFIKDMKRVWPGPLQVLLVCNSCKWMYRSR